MYSGSIHSKHEGKQAAVQLMSTGGTLSSLEDLLALEAGSREAWLIDSTGLPIKKCWFWDGDVVGT